MDTKFGMFPVKSSNLQAVGYDYVTKFLSVRFRNGKLYVYSGVMLDEVLALLTADSIGSYFAAHITPNHEVRFEETDSRSKGDNVRTDQEPINTAQEDDCCKPLRAKNISELETWTCRKCGCEWKPEIVEPIRHWKPVVLVMVLPAPGTSERE